MTRKKQLCISFSVFCFLAGLYFAFDVLEIEPSGGDAFSGVHRSDGDSASSQVSAGEPKLQGSGNGQNYSEAEKQMVNHTLEQMASLLKATETQNTETVYDREFEETRRVVMRVMPPTRHQIDEIFTALTSAVEALQANSAVERQMREMGTALIHVVTLRNGRGAGFTEYFVNDERLFMFQENGDYNLPLPPQSVMRMDENFGHPNSWAAKRYSHLLSTNLKGFQGRLNGGSSLSP